MYSIIPYQRYLSERNHHYRRLELCNHKSSCGLVLPLCGQFYINHPLQENTAYPILNHQLGMVYDWHHVNKSGWWYTYPSENMTSSVGTIIPIYIYIYVYMYIIYIYIWKNNPNVPNHQPENLWICGPEHRPSRCPVVPSPRPSFDGAHRWIPQLDDFFSEKPVHQKYGMYPLVI